MSHLLLIQRGVGLTFIVALFLSIANPANAGLTPFTEEAVARGLDYVMQDYPQQQGYLGFGCAFSDLDQDGDPDAIIVGAADGTVGIYENDGTGNFIDRSAGSGIPILTEASAIAIADYNGDGFPDIFLSQVAEPNVFVRNNGNFTFSDVSAAAQVDDAGSGKGAAFGDLDGDGRLDLYVTNYNGIVPGTELLDNVLYQNMGDGTFSDISVAQGVDNEGYGYQAVWFDMDLDNDLDLYLSNDRAALAPMIPNQLWRNDNGTLVNISASSGADVAIDSMGVAAGDFDGNGHFDLYCTNVPGVGGLDNPLLLNQGDQTFIEFGVAAGVQNSVSGTSWGAIFFDFDNSGTLDLYVNNQFFPNTFYVNPGNFPCFEAGAVFNVQGNDGRSFGSAVADVDADGDIDLLVNNLGGNVELFINQEGTERSWVRYNMIGTGHNTHAIGGRTITNSTNGTVIREVRAGGNNYLGQNELVMHIGLDTATTVDVVATWPGGTPSRILTDLPANHEWTLYPPDALGDSDGSGIVNNEDFPGFLACYNQPFAPGCEIMDFDGDSDVDDDDFDAFLTAHKFLPVDCNGNGTADVAEILQTPALDLDNDGFLDACVGVPTMGSWGVAIMLLLLTSVSSVVFLRLEAP